MPIYKAPLKDQQFVLHEVLGAVDELKQAPRYADLDEDTVNHVIEEAARFCEDVLLPTNMVGDEEGCTYDPATRSVKTPKGFKEAFDKFREAGWQGLAGEIEYGGQGLPHLLQIIFYEMQYSTNQAWSMYPGLTIGAYECLLRHASEEQKNLYLPKLVSGQWTGTMCLTEPQCGTDLGMLRSRAVPQPDGSYKITGEKIFISSGEHDMAENIIHLVLARLPDAPAGTKGISLFVVPKFVPVGSGADAKVGARNGLYCAGLEEKMGIHGNATCQIVLDNATGWLVGEPNKGLNAMFVMMNGARLGVGVQGLGLTEVAYQNAAAYAQDRIQGRSLSGVKSPGTSADPIIVHPDVRRMLLTARAYAEGGRAFAYWVALMADLQLQDPDEEKRKFAADMMSLMTPIVKAFMTDNGYKCATECQQVYGGHGYIRQNGMEQFVRDARINMVYEGTNTIQSLDLLGRKVLMQGGQGLRLLAQRASATASRAAQQPALAEHALALNEALARLGQVTQSAWAGGEPAETLANATPYLQAFGHVVLAWIWLDVALCAQSRLAGGGDESLLRGKLGACRYFFRYELPRIDAWLGVVETRDDTCRTMADEWF